MCKESIVADAIVSAIEDLVYKGKITPSESYDYYMLLSNSLSLPDLIPKPLKRNGFNLEALRSRASVNLKTDGDRYE